jgi:AcrR family transcriptional regulator
MKSNIKQQTDPVRGAARETDDDKPAARKGQKRLPRAERQALVLSKAAAYFAEHGLTAQTRAIAEACGISQRLLYSLFPSKAALVEAVYEREVAGIFKAMWFVELQDRSVPLEKRLVKFYCDYYETVLTHRWLRLILYSSLADLRMAPTYTNAIVTHTLEIVMGEAADALKKGLPQNRDEVAEIGWMLHGAVSHLAIRRRIYANENPTSVKQVIEMTVKAFLVSLPALLPDAQALASSASAMPSLFGPAQAKKVAETRSRKART